MCEVGQLHGKTLFALRAQRRSKAKDARREAVALRQLWWMKRGLKALSINFVLEGWGLLFGLGEPVLVTGIQLPSGKRAPFPAPREAACNGVSSPLSRGTTDPLDSL